MSKLSYKDAGVDIDAGNSLVEKIKPLAKSTFSPLVLGGVGSFSGAYELPSGYKEPVLMAATDGVGTKLKLAIDSGKLEGVGIDLVAMCVNDLICNFAEPMFFLDYYATGKLSVEHAEIVIASIAEGCKRAECSLIGGETAEMPGMYFKNDFDLAGFSVGIAEKADAMRENRCKAGDILVALPSSGVHSNGYSLVRKLIFERLGRRFTDDFRGESFADVLLKPTRIYVKEFKKLKSKLNALSHITGGGITENLPRVLPDGLKAVVKRSSIRVLPIFEYMGEHVEEAEMMRTFNMGVGMVWVVSVENVAEVLANSDGYVVGELATGDKEVEYI
jgi:phosphoribosylformylglycinamidine cyclo-ligase